MIHHPLRARPLHPMKPTVDRSRWNRLRRGGAVAALSVVLGLGACGGSTEQYEPFVPQRLFAFGDEASALSDGSDGVPKGSNWAVNGLASDGSFNCATLPIWTQSLADLYGFVFEECNWRNVAQPQARTWARAGARVADVEAQVAAQEASGGVRDGDLAAMLVGTHDLLDLYAQYPTVSRDDLVREARARGRHAGELVNRLVRQGSKVIVSNVPDLGTTPYALQERAAHSDTDRAALITDLSSAFNAGLGITVILDGRYVGLVQIDQRVQAITRSPGSYGMNNVTGAVCATAPPACRTDTLVTGATAGASLWASDRFFAAGGHSQLGAMAIDRARGNPF